MSFSLCNLGEVFVAHRSQLRAIAYNIVKSPALAEEIMHDAYLRLAEGSCAREVEKPYSYCCQIVRNLSLDHCRRQSLEATYRVYTEDGELPDVPGPVGPDQVLHERRLLDAVEQVLDSLPRRTRMAFELYRHSGLTQREIAASLKCSATLVNFMLRDVGVALAGCRELMDEL